MRASLNALFPACSLTTASSRAQAPHFGAGNRVARQPDRQENLHLLCGFHRAVGCQNRRITQYKVFEGGPAAARPAWDGASAASCTWCPTTLTKSSPSSSPGQCQRYERIREGRHLQELRVHRGSCCKVGPSRGFHPEKRAIYAPKG